MFTKVFRSFSMIVYRECYIKEDGLGTIFVTTKLLIALASISKNNELNSFNGNSIYQKTY